MGVCVCVGKPLRIFLCRLSCRRRFLENNDMQTNKKKNSRILLLFLSPERLLDDVVQGVVRFGTRRIYQVQITDGIKFFH